MNAHVIKPVVKFARTDPMAQVPSYESAQAAGMDLQTLEGFVLEPNEVKLVDTGLKMQIPMGFEAQIRPRSGLALKKRVTVLNSPGTIDSDYRGPVKVLLINHGKEAVEFQCNDRIAQMVIAPVTQVVCKIVFESELDSTERGAGGFGSTGR